MALLDQDSDDARAAHAAAAATVGEALAAVLLAIEQEVVGAASRLEAESATQEAAFGEANVATASLASNSELVALGLTLDGLAARLLSLDKAADMDAMEANIATVYAQVARAKTGIGQLLAAIEAKDESTILDEVERALGSVEEIKRICAGLSGMHRLTKLLSAWVSIAVASARNCRNRSWLAGGQLDQCLLNLSVSGPTSTPPGLRSTHYPVSTPRRDRSWDRFINCASTARAAGSTTSPGR